MRYDPVWRRIKPDSFTDKLEGAFPDRLRRLDRLNNWGVLAWLYPHAAASKLTHHYGLERNAMEFLGGDSERSKYRPSFRTASHVLHWGHLPLSYASEEALLRAAHVDSRTASLLHRVIDEVIAAGDLRCDADDHTCASAVRSGDHYSDLYRWLSAWIVHREWKRVWKAVRAAADEDTASDEAETKRAIIRALACREDRGYQILSMCNEADYVPRDLLQAGTAWLTVDIEALWEPNPLGADAAREWSLIEAARQYLDERFFQQSESLLVHSLAARAIAGRLIADKLSSRSLYALLHEGDDYFLRQTASYHGARLTTISKQAHVRWISNTWVHVGKFSNVSLPRGSRFDMEDWLTGRSGTARMSYPFSSSTLVAVDLGDDHLPDFLAGASRRYASVHVYQAAASKNDAPPLAFDALDILARVAQNQVPGPEAGNRVMSWILGGPAEQRDTLVREVCGEIAADSRDPIRTCLRRVIDLRSLQPIWEHTWVSTLYRQLANGTIDGESAYGNLLLRLPWAGMRTAGGREVLRLLRTRALERVTVGSRSSRGFALEVAAAADQWLADGAPAHRLVMTGTTLLGKDGQPAHEWDVVRIDVHRDRTWDVTAVECAISRSTTKDDDARSKLELLRTCLQGRFGDLAQYRTLLATVGPGQKIAYEDAGRGFTPVP